MPATCSTTLSPSGVQVSTRKVKWLLSVICRWNLCAGSPKREPRPSPKGAGSREPSWWEYEGVVMAEGSTVATHATRQRFPHGIEPVRHALLKVPNHPGLAPKDRDRKGLVGCPS